MQAKIIKWVSNIIKKKAEIDETPVLRKEIEKLSDFAKQYAHDSRFTLLEESLNKLYVTFSGYKKPSRISCCYLYKQSQQILNYEIQEVPLSLIEGLEFYDNHWGEPNEVNYLLPRIMEEKVINLISRSTRDEFCLIDMALTGGAFIGSRLNPTSKWHKSARSIEEQEAIMNFIHAFFDFIFHNTTAIYELLEAFDSQLSGFHLDANNNPVIGFPLDAQRLLESWDKVEPALRKKQFQHYMNEAYIATKDGGSFYRIIFSGTDITSWVVSDKHIVEFDLCEDVHFSNMILNDAISKRSQE